MNFHCTRKFWLAC